MVSMVQAIAINRRSNRWGKVSVSQLAFFGTLFAAAPAAFDTSREVCAIGIAALTLLPVVVIWRAKRRLLVADPIIAMGFAWLLAVPLPVFLPFLYKDRLWYILSTWSLDLAALWMYRGWAACCLAYWGGRIVIGEPRRQRISAFDLLIEVRLQRAVGALSVLGGVLYILFTGGQTSQIFEDTATADSSLRQIILLLSELSCTYVYLYFYTCGRRQFGKVDTYLLYAVLSVEAVILIGAGTKYGILALGAAYVLGNVAGTSRPNFLREVTLVAASIVAVFMVSYVVAAYRGEVVVRRRPPLEAPIFEHLSFQADAMLAAITTVIKGKEIGRGYYTDYNSSYVFDRFAHVSSLAYFLEVIRFTSPYENAYASLIAPVFAVIPRALFEDKVRFFQSGDFARMVGWTYGGISITTPGSFFWAWGYTGIIAGMTGIGLAFAWLWPRGGGEGSRDLIWRVVTVYMIIGFLDVGVTFQMVIVPATRVLLLLLFTRWGIRMLSRSFVIY